MTAKSQRQLDKGEGNRGQRIGNNYTVTRNVYTTYKKDACDVYEVTTFLGLCK